VLDGKDFHGWYLPVSKIGENMIAWYWLIVAVFVGGGLAWGYRGWIARTKEKVQRKF